MNGKAERDQSQNSYPNMYSDEAIFAAGALPEGLFAAKQEAPKTPLDEILERHWQREDVNHFVADLKVRTGFEERDRHLKLPIQLVNTVMRLRKYLPGGKVETYADKLKREEAKKHTESAAYGIAQIGGKDCVLYTMHWDFFAGSLGIVAGEKFKRAARLATKRGIPLVGVYSSGGVRQHENFAGLVQMSRMAYEIDRFKKKTGMPYVSVLAGEVWGGVSASAVPLGDVRVAVKGANYGFTGPRVIKTYEKKEVAVGAQSAAAHMLYRNVDVVVDNMDETMRMLTGIITAASHRHEKKRPEPIGIADVHPIHSMSLKDRFTFRQGFSTFINGEGKIYQQDEKTVFPKKEPPKETLDQLVETLSSNSARPDTEFLLYSCFTDVVPLYSRVVLEDGSIQYPAIIAGIGKIGEQQFLVIGNQPSHKKYSEEVIAKRSASPTPADFRYLLRMLDLGERYGLPVVFFTDTPGARPTLDAEIVGQSEVIAEAIRKTNTYKYPTISIVTGMLGSGGGLATTPIADHVAMMERSLAFVAEPTSATSILYSEDNPDRDKVKKATDDIGPTAKEQLENELIDAIIPEPEGGAEADPHEAAEAVRNHIASIFSRDAWLSLRALNKRREFRMSREHHLLKHAT